MKVFALILYKNYDHNPTPPRAIVSSHDFAKVALLHLDANVQFENDNHGSCSVLDGWSVLDRWMISEYELDIIPD